MTPCATHPVGNTCARPPALSVLGMLCLRFVLFALFSTFIAAVPFSRLRSICTKAM